MMNLQPIPADVGAVFNSYPAETKAQLLSLRQTIFALAAAEDGIGPLEETLKWGQISYLTPKSKSGTTIRIDAVEGRPDILAIYVHCQTTLIESFRPRYAGELEFEGNRGLRFDVHDSKAKEAVEEFIWAALTYHQKKSS